MLRDTITRIEARLQGHDALDADARAELLALVRELEREVGELAEPLPEEAGHLAAHAEASVAEATRPARDEELLGSSIEGMRAAARRLGVGDSRLAGVVDAISRALLEIGL